MTLTVPAPVDTGVVTLDAGPWGTRDVQWGLSWEHGTAAYWLEATRRATRAQQPNRHRLTETLCDEVALCMLGGFGMPYEVALAAYAELHARVLSHTRAPSEADIAEVLLQPLRVGAAIRRYRFPHQRAQRLSAALTFLNANDHPTSPLEMRDFLTRAPGIGLKTASWIVRNRWPEAQVAILDVHVLRAGARAKVFPRGVAAQSSYHYLEALFVAWARQEHVDTADLDATIWAEEAHRARRPF